MIEQLSNHPAFLTPMESAQYALSWLRGARKLLQQAGAKRSTMKVGRAIKSTEGAIRNIEYRITREKIAAQRGS